MFVVSVTVLVKMEHVEAFIAATMDNARGTRGEAGNIRFDVSRGLEDRGRFLLYEVYKSSEDFVAHQQTAHYLKWKGLVTDWMREPRVGVKHESLFFGEGEG